MTWAVPTTEQIREHRLRDGPNYLIPQEYLANLVLHESGAVYFPIYALDGTQVGWNGRARDQKIWSQTLSAEVTPRFTSWTPQLSRIVYAARKIFLVEGPYDAYALAPIIPWVISTNTARVQQEILEWCKMWKLHVFTAFDLDLPDPKTQRSTGQLATEKVSKELEKAGCIVSHVSIPRNFISMSGGFPQPVVIKDPAQAFAVMGSAFHSHVLQQVQAVLTTTLSH